MNIRVTAAREVKEETCCQLSRLQQKLEDPAGKTVLWIPIKYACYIHELTGD